MMNVEFDSGSVVDQESDGSLSGVLEVTHHHLPIPYTFATSGSVGLALTAVNCNSISTTVTPIGTTSPSTSPSLSQLLTVQKVDHESCEHNGNCEREEKKLEIKISSPCYQDAEQLILVPRRHHPYPMACCTFSKSSIDGTTSSTSPLASIPDESGIKNSHLLHHNNMHLAAATTKPKVIANNVPLHHRYHQSTAAATAASYTASSSRNEQGESEATQHHLSNLMVSHSTVISDVIPATRSEMLVKVGGGSGDDDDTTLEPPPHDENALLTAAGFIGHHRHHHRNRGARVGNDILSSLTDNDDDNRLLGEKMCVDPITTTGKKIESTIITSTTSPTLSYSSVSLLHKGSCASAAAAGGKYFVHSPTSPWPLPLHLYEVPPTTPTPSSVIVCSFDQVTTINPESCIQSRVPALRQTCSKTTTTAVNTQTPQRSVTTYETSDSTEEDDSNFGVGARKSFSLASGCGVLFSASLYNDIVTLATGDSNGCHPKAATLQHLPELSCCPAGDHINNVPTGEDSSGWICGSDDRAPTGQNLLRQPTTITKQQHCEMKPEDSCGWLYTPSTTVDDPATEHKYSNDHDVPTMLSSVPHRGRFACRTPQLTIVEDSGGWLMMDDPTLPQPPTTTTHSHNTTTQQHLDRRPHLHSNFHIAPLAPRHTHLLALSLKGTLVYAVTEGKGIKNQDAIVSIRTCGEESLSTNLLVHYRPHLTYFITTLMKHFDIAIFSTGEQDYVDALLDVMDPSGQVFPKSRRYYRQHCTKVVPHYTPNDRNSEGTKTIAAKAFLTKNLRTLGRPLSEIILVDDTASSGVLQPNNLLLIPTWTGDPSDTALLKLTNDLLHIANSGRILSLE